MSHDYSQYTAEKTVSGRMPVDTEPLTWKAECDACGWVNRRSMKRNAVRSKKFHEQNDGCAVQLEQTDSPIKSDDE